MLATLLLTTVLGLPPPDAATAEVATAVGVADRFLEVSPAGQSVLDEHMLDAATHFVANVTGTDWVPPLCTVPSERRCVPPVSTSTVVYRNASGAAIATEAYLAPATCALSNATFVADGATRWCATVVASNATRIALHGVVQVSPGMQGVVQAVIGGFRRFVDNATLTQCGLRPSAVYNVWGGDGVPGCSRQIVTPVAAHNDPPWLVDQAVIPITRWPTTISFYFRFPEQLDVVDANYVEYIDTYANVTHRSLWTGVQSVVPSVNPAFLGLVYRTFAIGLFPNTLYRLRVALALPNGTQLSSYSSSFEATTLHDVQAKPNEPVQTVINSSHVRVSPAPFREYGVTRGIHFLLFFDDPDTLDDPLIANVTCPGLCPDGIEVARPTDSGVLFIELEVVNDVGTSPRGDAAVILPYEPSGGGGGDGGLLVVALSTSLALAAVVIGVLWYCVRAARRRTQRPRGPLEHEIDPSLLEYVREIGSGATSVVYSGHRLLPDGTVSEAVAVKRLNTTLSDARIAAILKEVMMLGTLSHPHVLRLVGSVTKTDPYLIVTELCAAGSLDTHLREHAVDADTKWRWAAEMAMGLDYTHSRGVLHRDVAARNYLLTEALVIKLGDFGMSRAVGDKRKEHQNSEGVNNSVRWSCRQGLVHGEFSKATDTWALAVTYCELYSDGELPYAGVAELNEVYELVVSGATPNIPDATPPPLRDAIAKVWDHPATVCAGFEVLFPALGTHLADPDAYIEFTEVAF